MNTNSTYKVNDKISFVIANDYRLLQVVSRCGISLGFGDNSIEYICNKCEFDPYTFISIINYVSNGRYDNIDFKKIDLSSILKYLKNTHIYFLDFQFANVRRHLLYAIDCSIKNELAFLVLKFYDEYVEEVKKHMDFEEKTTFTYVESIINGHLKTNNKKSKINILSHHHHDIEDRLKELKRLFIQYYPQTEVDNRLNSALFELYRTQDELMIHCGVEEKIFMPSIKFAETQLQNKINNDHIIKDNANSDTDSTLSLREKEVVICVAKGMSNKEIADKLFLSVNTVTTHRRNIARKLSIHTTAGITIYAIVNKLVSFEDVNI